ncbi:MAG: WYL domain-containing protein [Thiolinea sp.]
MKTIESTVPAPHAVWKIDYTNWKGETRERRINPGRVWYGDTEFHPKRQWLLQAFDIEKQAVRNFALADIHSVTVERPMTQTCSSCQFWRNPQKSIGECHKKSPGISGDGSEMAVWPITPGWDDCGDWEQSLPVSADSMETGVRQQQGVVSYE